jgi:hypothetical protein
VRVREGNGEKVWMRMEVESTSAMVDIEEELERNKDNLEVADEDCLWLIASEPWNK